MVNPPTSPTSDYDQALTGESEYWDNFIAERLLRGEMPGSIDWRINFTQFRYNHDWRPLCLGPQGINFRMREIHYVLTHASVRPGMRVLDLGCGAGWLSLELARQGAHVTALDISPTNLAIGRHMAATNARNFPFLYQRFAGLPCRLEDFGSVDYAYADLNTVTLPAGEYDAVVVWDSLHHIRDLERLLDQVRVALKPDGLFLGVDHAFATARTEEFNRAVYPILEDCYVWITAADPRWFYEGMNALGAQHDWSLLAVDYDATPVPGVDGFLPQLFDELLEIIRTSLRQEALDKARAHAVGSAGPTTQVEEESPFEDVSADRLMRVLLEEFEAVRFQTVCPLIHPERHIPHYRNEPERIFQQYLAAALIHLGEQAITRGQAVGQWFLFHLTPQRPAGPLSFAIPVSGHTDPDRERIAQLASELVQRGGYIAHLESILIRQGDYTAHMEAELTGRADYIARLESEISRKNTALADHETRLHALEEELNQARAPLLPWKRRTPRR